MSETPKTVDLNFLAEQNRRIIADMGSLRDDLNVLTSIVLRLDGTVTGLLAETRATHTQIQRLAERVRRLEPAS